MTGVFDFVTCPVCDDARRTVGDQHVTCLGQIIIITINDCGSRARAIHGDITRIRDSGIIARNDGTRCALRNGLISFANNQRLITCDVQSGRPRAGDRGVAGVINHRTVTGHFGSGRAVGNV